MLVLPTVDETPEPLRDASGAIIYPGFPADVLYEFRLVSLATQLVLWATIGLVFATLAGRLLDGEPRRTGIEHRRVNGADRRRPADFGVACDDRCDGGRALPRRRTAQRHRPSAGWGSRNRHQRVHSPTRRTRATCRQTAELLGLHAANEPRLADLDCGGWRGERWRHRSARRPADVADRSGSAPHGGESIVELIDRVGGWLKSLTRQHVTDRRGDTSGGDPGGDPGGS